MTCLKLLQAQGGLTPRTCPDCGLGPCGQSPVPVSDNQFLGDEPGTDASIDVKVKQLISYQSSMRESFVAQYLTSTGASIEDTVLVEQRLPDKILFWCEPKGMR